MFESPEAFPVNKFEFKTPPTVRLVRTPTDVILGWEFWETTRARSDSATLPVTLEPVSEYRAAPFPAIFETIIEDGRSALTRALNEGVPGAPIDGPANT